MISNRIDQFEKEVGNEEGFSVYYKVLLVFHHIFGHCLRFYLFILFFNGQQQLKLYWE